VRIRTLCAEIVRKRTAHFADRLASRLWGRTVGGAGRFRLSGIAVAEKNDMRRLALRGGLYSESERPAL
jgi:hypothetical protein